MNRLLLAAALCSALLPAAGCKSGARVAAPAASSRLGRQVVPLPPEFLASFTATGGEVVRVADRARVRALAAAPSDFGRPLVSSVDLGSLMAAVVHERGLAVLNLTSPEAEPAWLPLAWTSPPAAVFVADAWAATLGGTEACLWDLNDAVLLQRVDLGAWSKERRLGPPVCVVPDRETQSRATVLFSSRERTDLQVLDLARGAPEMVASASSLFENTRQSWYLVERCAYDGESLFLSGTHEEVKLDTLGRPVPTPSPFLTRLDLATRTTRMLFHEDSHARDQDVVELAAAAGLVATLRRDGLLRVFRDREKVYEGEVARGSALAWLDERSLAVYGADALDVVRIAP